MLFANHNVGIEHLPIRAARLGKRALQYPPPSLRDTFASGGYAPTFLFQHHQRISLHLSCPPPAGVGGGRYHL